MKILRIPSISENKVMLINISKRYSDELKDDRAKLYEAIRKGWKVDTNSAKEIDYVYCIANGIIVAVYRNTQWRYMKELEGYGTQRLEFEGEEVVDSVKKQGDGAVGRYDWYTAREYVPSGHLGVVLDFP